MLFWCAEADGRVAWKAECDLSGLSEQSSAQATEGDATGP